MRKFFISSHGHMASGIKSSLEILMGPQDNVTFFDAYVDQDRVEDHVEAFLATVGEEDQAIMLSDLYGGSVNQVLYTYLDRPNTFLVAGVNLALVLELVAASANNISKEELEEIVDMSRYAIKVLTLDKDEEPESEESFF